MPASERTSRGSYSRELTEMDLRLRRIAQSTREGKRGKQMTEIANELQTMHAVSHHDTLELESQDTPK